MEALCKKKWQKSKRWKISHLHTAYLVAVQNFTYRPVFVFKVASFRQPKVHSYIWTDYFFLSKLINQSIISIRWNLIFLELFITKSYNYFVVPAVPYPWWILEGVMLVWVLWPEPPLFWCCFVWWVACTWVHMCK